MIPRSNSDCNRSLGLGCELAPERSRGARSFVPEAFALPSPSHHGSKSGVHVAGIDESPEPPSPQPSANSNLVDVLAVVGFRWATGVPAALAIVAAALARLRWRGRCRERDSWRAGRRESARTPPSAAITARPPASAAPSASAPAAYATATSPRAYCSVAAREWPRRSCWWWHLPRRGALHRRVLLRPFVLLRASGLRISSTVSAHLSSA